MTNIATKPRLMNPKIARCAMRQAHHRRRAFTLVELLVAVGVVVILVSIILTAILTARQAAVRTACASNLRQIGIAIQAYAADNNGEIPAVYGPIENMPGRWRGPISGSARTAMEMPACFCWPASPPVWHSTATSPMPLSFCARAITFLMEPTRFPSDESATSTSTCRRAADVCTVGLPSGGRS